MWYSSTILIDIPKRNDCRIHNHKKKIYPFEYGNHWLSLCKIMISKIFASIQQCEISDNSNSYICLLLHISCLK